MKKNLILTTALLILSINYCFACTAFCIVNNGKCISARNYDWSICSGYLLTNSKGITKESYNIDSGDKNILKWKSLYNSVTFNQYGKEFPTSGINEAGLIIDVLYLTESVYPTNENLPSVNEMQWVQYMLDNASSVNEVITLAPKVNIKSLAAKIHYFIADISGKSATVEFVEGKMLISNNSLSGICAITNDTYQNSVKYAIEKNKIIHDPTHSLNRFNNAFQLSKNLDQHLPNLSNSDLIDSAFYILEKVKDPSSTQWSIVYDINNLKVYYKTKEAGLIKYFDLKQMSSYFHPLSTYYLDLNNAKLAGNISNEFISYNIESNTSLLKKALVSAPTALMQSNIDFVKQISFFQMHLAYPTQDKQPRHTLKEAHAAKERLINAVNEDPKSIPKRIELMKFYMLVPGIAGGSRKEAFKQADEIFQLNNYDGNEVYEWLYAYEKNYAKAAEYYHKNDALAEAKTTTIVHLKNNSSYQNVFVAGSFTDWNQLPMYFVNNEWVRRIKIKKGRYEYKFIIDGNWILDPENSLIQKTKEGISNSLLIIN
jgi:choloylglycine hydrolase